MEKLGRLSNTLRQLSPSIPPLKTVQLPASVTPLPAKTTTLEESPVAVRSQRTLPTMTAPLPAKGVTSVSSEVPVVRQSAPQLPSFAPPMRTTTPQLPTPTVPLQSKSVAFTEQSAPTYHYDRRLPETMPPPAGWRQQPDSTAVQSPNPTQRIDADRLIPEPIRPRVIRRTTTIADI